MSELTDKKIIFDSNVVLGDGTGSTDTLDALLSASAQEVADPTKDTATIYFTGGAGEPKIVVNGADYTGYHKPTNGIPYADLDSSAKEKLDNGDAVYAQLYDQKVSSWSSTTSNERFPSEKLVKDSLDAKA